MPTNRTLVDPEREAGRRAPSPDLQADGVGRGFDPLRAVLGLQRTAGNQAVQRLLHPAAPARIQRLVTGADFDQRTKAGSAGSQAVASFIQALKLYEGMGTSPPSDRISFLWKLKGHLLDWLGSPEGQKSACEDAVRSLAAEVQGEISQLGAIGAPPPSPGSATHADFTDANVTAAENEKYGGALNKLDELTYAFGIDPKGQKVPPGTDPFVGVFKPDKEKTPQFDTEDARRKRAEEFAQSKGPRSGIRADDQRIIERNLAVRAVNDLLAADVIPATFKAKHSHDAKALEGIVMEKVKGKDGKPEGITEIASAVNLKRFEVEKDPVVRRGLSNLYLLDAICGQVDRHKGNYIIEVASGKIAGVKAIDNDLAFGARYTDIRYTAAGVDPQTAGWHAEVSAGKRADQLTEIDRDFAQRIIALAQQDGPLRQALAAYLHPAEIDATISRLRSLADFLRPLLEQSSPKIVSVWK
jgi:hypothetical protein